MNWKHPTLISALKANGLDINRRDIGFQLADILYQHEARETIPDPDLDQPATLEWVRGRDGWTTRAFIEHAGVEVLGRHVEFKRVLHPGVGRFQSLSVGEIIEDNPTRRQVIAAERCAREMGWV